MNELALFSGGGGGLLGSILLGHKIVGAVEIEPYCREIIMRRQRDGLLPVFPIWDDVRTFDGEPWRGKVDLITAGFPCQPFSVAGRGKGEEDDRNMWPETIRIIRQVEPRFALLENVPGLLAHPYFGTILGELAESGYHARWTCLGADDIGANHRRKRLWILAYPEGEQNRWVRKPGFQSNIRTSGKDVADAFCSGRSREPWRGAGAESPVGHFGLEEEHDVSDTERLQRKGGAGYYEAKGWKCTASYVRSVNFRMSVP